MVRKERPFLSHPMRITSGIHPGVPDSLPSALFLYRLHGTSRGIITLSVSSCRFRICASFYCGPLRRRVLDRTIYSATLSCTSTHILKYCCFILKLKYNSMCCCSSCASTPSTLPAEKTSEVKFYLRSIQGWRYLVFYLPLSLLAPFQYP